jgi:alanine racemase
MDQFVLDLGPDARAQAGDVVTLFGGGPDEPTAQDWADATDTISYEIVTRLGPRVPRIHVGGPHAAGTSPADGAPGAAATKGEA